MRLALCADARHPDGDQPGGRERARRTVRLLPTERRGRRLRRRPGRGLLDTKGYAPNRILWLGPNSEPLARLFAQWWEVDPENIRPYQHGDNTEDGEDISLLVMAHSYDVN